MPDEPSIEALEKSAVLLTVASWPDRERPTRVVGLHNARVRLGRHEPPETPTRVGDLRTAMLHYAVGTHHIYLTLIGQGGEVLSIRLASVAEVAPPAERLTRMLRAPTRFATGELAEALQAFSSDWGRRLLPSPDTLNNYDVLVVVPHHFLHDLPFHLIRTGQSEECLGNRFGIAVNSSATMFERAVSRNPARVAEVSGWQFHSDGGDPAGAPPRPELCCFHGVDVIGDDPRYAELAESCAGQFPAQAPLWHRAGLKSSQAESADAICIVCHGVTNPQAYDDSGLLLTDAPGVQSRATVNLHLGVTFTIRDLPFTYLPPQVEVAPRFGRGGVLPELMTIAEVRTSLETQAQLVMLVGCSTATGQLRSGDSYVSLAHQWLQAGAVSVLAHQWEADFPFVSAWVPIFLRNWVRRRQPKAVAFRDALNEALEHDLVPRDALSIWGAVVLLGDWI